MLPGRGLIARIRGKGDAYGAILASWALGPPQCKEGMRGFMGRRGGWRRWRVAALGQATQRVAASAERARRAAGLAGAADAAMVGTVGAVVQGRRWWARWCGDTALVGAARGGANGRGAAEGGCDAGDSTGTRGTTGAMEAGDGWPRGVGARSAQYASSSGGYSPKLASITATRSSSAPMSCWFTSSIFCKSAGEAFST